MKTSSLQTIIILLILNGFFMASCQIRSIEAGKMNNKENSTGQKRLSDEEVERMAGWNEEADRRAPGDRFGESIERAANLPPVSPAGNKASLVNEKYGKHERNVFDIWMSDGNEPAPLIVFIHGGGFIRGDKSLLYESDQLDRLLSEGFAVAGVNYRFIHQDEDAILTSLDDIKYFIQYVRHHADRLNIDKNRIGTYGGSAGGAASLWLAFSPEMAEPESDDPILRESTRVSCVGAMATPSTLDLSQWIEILGLPEFTKRDTMEMLALYGLEDEEELFAENTAIIRKKVDMLGLMSPDDPEFYVYNNEKGGIPKGKGHAGHHPNHARVLKERAEDVGVPAVIGAPKIGIVPEREETLIDFFIRILKVN
jgi:pimeloyl-ACP methyl ester carboxylesterase